jgi:phosphoglycolate phosphatase-like HAD superfamily hydrolase
MSKIIVLDADGVMVDYRESYPLVWKKAFGTELPVVNPNSYHAANQYGVAIPQDELLTAKFFAHFDEDIWATLPALPEAVAACLQLSNAGFDLMCVSALPAKFEKARLQNLQDLGFPIDKVYATGHTSEANPKLDVLLHLNPAVFVDDMGSNFVGLSDSIHKALIDGGHHDNPNTAEHRSISNSVHNDLAGFSQYWLNRKI